MITREDPLSLVHALDEACNAHDLAMVLSLFAPDAVVTHTPPPDGMGIYHGAKQIRGWFEPQIAGFHVESRDHRLNGNCVSWRALVTHDLLRQHGQSQPVDAQLEAVVREGKIVSFHVTNPSPIANA